jgi:hypothetical protein
VTNVQGQEFTARALDANDRKRRRQEAPRPACDLVSRATTKIKEIEAAMSERKEILTKLAAVDAKIEGLLTSSRS